MSNEWDDELASATPVERIMARAKFRATTDDAFLALMEDTSISGNTIVEAAINRAAADAVKAYRDEVVREMMARVDAFCELGGEAQMYASRFARLTQCGMEDLARAVAKAVGA